MRQLSLRMCKEAHEIEINTPACPQGQEKCIEIRNYHCFKKTAKTSDEKAHRNYNTIDVHCLQVNLSINF